jgi:hypothetical protein
MSIHEVFMKFSLLTMSLLCLSSAYANHKTYFSDDNKMCTLEIKKHKTTASITSEYGTDTAVATTKDKLILENGISNEYYPVLEDDNGFSRQFLARRTLNEVIFSDSNNYMLNYSEEVFNDDGSLRESRESQIDCNNMTILDNEKLESFSFKRRDMIMIHFLPDWGGKLITLDVAGVARDLNLGSESLDATTQELGSWSMHNENSLLVIHFKNDSFEITADRLDNGYYKSIVKRTNHKEDSVSVHYTDLRKVDAQTFETGVTELEMLGLKQSAFGSNEPDHSWEFLPNNIALLNTEFGSIYNDWSISESGTLETSRFLGTQTLEEQQQCQASGVTKDSPCNFKFERRYRLIDRDGDKLIFVRSTSTIRMDYSGEKLIIPGPQAIAVFSK